jgi:hypothetical protein
MDKSVLLNWFSQCRQNAERHDRFISHQREVIAMLEKEGLAVDDSMSLMAASVSARDKDLVEMDWTLDELDKTAGQPVSAFSTPSLWPLR